MFRKLCLTSALLISSIAIASPASAEIPVKIYMNGQSVSFEVSPVIEDGTTLVPFRKIFEKLGLSVSWNGDTQTVKGSNDKLQVEFQIGGKTAVVNGKKINLDVAPKIVEGNTLVPLRFVSEHSSQKVTWYGNSKSITINSATYSEKSDDLSKYNEVAIDEDKVNYLVNNYDFENKKLNRFTNPSEMLLYYTSYDRNLELIEYALIKGADPNVKDGLGRTPLSYSVSPSLLNDPNSRGKSNTHTPTYEEDIATTKLLLKYKADPNLESQGLVLGWAVTWNRIEIVKMLLDAGADTNKTVPNYWPALIIALGENHNAFAAMFGVTQPIPIRKYEIAKLLLEHKADPNNIKYFDGRSPLQLASSSLDTSYTSCIGVAAGQPCKEVKGEILPPDKELVDLLIKYGAKE